MEFFKHFLKLRYIVIIVILAVFLWPSNTLTLTQPITIAKWDTYEVIFAQLWTIERLRLKRWMRSNTPPTLKPWVAEFSWSYTYPEFFDIIKTLGKPVYQKITLLEWRSRYDIDEYLTKQWLIAAWDYITAARDATPRSSGFDFLSTNKSTQLEWYLYPDTYLVSTWNLVNQLIRAQLQAYSKRTQSLNFDMSASLKSQWYDFELSPYSILILASILEREERSVANRPTVAGIFLNRIQKGMRIDADITVCFGMQAPLSLCTPRFITENITNPANGYNTRVISWLPPTPIANPSLSSIQAVLNFKKSAYLYYLHDDIWGIHYGETLEQHNVNKQNHL